MDKLQITEVNCTTGETIVRDATVEEIAQYKADQAAEAIKQAETEAKATARAAILDRLGLTAEEAALLLS
jgi:uncharacterized protein with ATP-grasp and redox domains